MEKQNMESTALLPSSSSDHDPSPNISPFSLSSSNPSETLIKINHDDHDHHKKKYDVFLNFRGDDTRKNILGHLRAALSEKGIKTFVDDEIERGQFISPQLLQAIEDSSCSVVILSQNYASSTWCLDELVKIMECMRIRAQVVMPVFYHVDPSHVRKQAGKFGGAFAKHDKKLADDIERVQSWRAALTQVSSLAGLDIRNFRDEASFIREIVAEVSRKLSSLVKAENSEDQKGNIEKESPISSFVSKAIICIGKVFAGIFAYILVFVLFGFFFFRVLVPIIENVVFGGDPFGYLDSRMKMP